MSLFQRTFNLNTNLKFIHAIQQAVTSKKYGKLERGFKKAVAMSQQVRSLEQQQREKEEEEEEEEVGEEVEEEVGEEGEGAATRKRKRPPQSTTSTTSTTSSTSSSAASVRSQLWSEWQSFSKQVVRFGLKRAQIEQSFVFAFTEGALVKALRTGQWVLLDEINLASPETLQRISSLLDGTQVSCYCMADISVGHDLLWAIIIVDHYYC
jgi:midasin